MILKNGVEGIHEEQEPTPKPVMHENIRGGTYYDRREQDEPKESETIVVVGSITKQSEAETHGATSSQYDLPFEVSTVSPGSPTVVYEKELGHHEESDEDVDAAALTYTTNNTRYTN